MSKSMFDLVGQVRGRHNRHVAMIEVRTQRDAVRRAKVAFWAVGSVVGVSAGVFASGVTTAGSAVLIGVMTGLMAGASVGLALFCWPLIRVMWHWAAEIVALTAGLTMYRLLVRSLPWWLAFGIIALGVLGPLGLPTIRRAVLPWLWCAVSRHRLRLCFAAFVASQRSGSTPLILLARPTPAGERVWIWLRPGLALADLETRLDRLAAGCWAAECRIAPASRRYSAMLRIDIARRNPLAATVNSPLPALVPTVDTSAVTFDAVSGGLDLPDVPDTPAVAPVRRPRPVTTASSPTKPVVDERLDWI